MIRESQGRHFEVDAATHKVVDAVRTVEQRVLAVGMEMNERHGSAGPICLSVNNFENVGYAGKLHRHFCGSNRLTDGKTVVSSAFDRVNIWRQHRRDTGHLLLALDFDGTIAPFAQRVQDAWMSRAAREALQRLLKRDDTDVAIISGRALDDLRERCDVPGVYYAGNHGLEIEGSGVHETRAEAVALVPAIQELAERLQAALGDIEGVYLENKRLSLSVHYRLIDDAAEAARVRQIVYDVFAGAAPGIKLTNGKKLVEVRPDIPWNKGNATLFLIETIEKAKGAPLYPVFIGDDVTDEDAFAALRRRGEGVLVTEEPLPRTAATASVPSVEGVIALVEALA